MMSKEQQECHHVFCYGSLRPDDDSGQAWTRDAVSGMRAQPANLFGAKLYLDTYAAVVMDTNNMSSSVVGWVLTVDSPDRFAEKLELFDAIEGYKPDGTGLYQRAVVDATLGHPDKATGGPPIGPMGDVVRAYVYHRPDCNKEHCIASGDWLLRDAEN